MISNLARLTGYRTAQGAVMALRRELSRGAHSGTDFPQPYAAQRRATLRLADAFAVAGEINPQTLPAARRT